MTFGIAGATLKGVSAVKAVPVLIDSEPVAMPITIVASRPPAETPVAARELAMGSEAIGAVKPLPLPGAVPDPVVLEEAAAPEIPPAVEPLEEAPGEDTPPEAEPLPEEVIREEVVAEEVVPEAAEPEEVAEENEPPEPVEPEPMDEEPEPEPPVVEKPEIEAKPPVPKEKPKPVQKQDTPPPAPKPPPRAKPSAKDPKLVVERPKVIYKAPLRYPVEAQRRGWGGKILLEVRISSSGKPERIRVINSSGYKMLDREAVAAVKASRFEPARNAYGKALSHTIRVPLNFGFATPR